jgi:hypothetical protein
MSEINRPLDEQQIDQLELRFPPASGVAFSQAYRQAVSAGLSVLISDRGKIVEVFPDGTRKTVKDIEPPTTAQPGQKFTIQ